MTIKEEVWELIQQLEYDPEHPEIEGATEDEILAFEERNNFMLPDELREWLKMCNGARIATGLYGIQKGRDNQSLIIESEFESFALWKKKGWIPLAGDGCGDYYILATRSKVLDTHPVFFIDHERSYYQPQYVVASGVWTFLKMLFKEEVQHESHRDDDDYDHDFPWPFDEEWVLKEDPALAYYEGEVPLAWEVDMI